MLITSHLPSASRAPAAPEKKEWGRAALIVIGAGADTGRRRALLCRAVETAALCVVLLTKRGVHAAHFQHGMQIHCLPRGEHFEFDGLAPRMSTPTPFALHPEVRRAA